MENDSDNKAQYQKTCNDRDGSYDLRRYNLRDKPNGTDNDRKQDSEFDEACPTEVADLLGRSRLLPIPLGFVRYVCLDEGRCVHVLIHDDCIHIGAFNSSRAVTRYSSSQSQVFVQTLGVRGRIVILALDTTKTPDGVTSSHVLTINGWQTINLDDQNDCPCQFGVEFLILWRCAKVVCQFILVENALHSLILQKYWC